MMHPQEIQAAFQRGENVTGLLRRATDSAVNTEEIIETAYDLQSGRYVAGLDDPNHHKHQVAYGRRIADEIAELVGAGASLLEPGVGEGTTMSFVIDARDDERDEYHGFDLSWSRIAVCRKWLTGRGLTKPFLAVGSLLQAPYAENSFDAVYTSHTIEPNGGREAPILQELYRIASRYLLLFEPGYEFAPPEAQERMERLGYVRDLAKQAESLGMKVVKNEPLGFSANPMNPTAIPVLEKNATAPSATPRLACPRFGDELERRGDCFYSPGSLLQAPYAENSFDAVYTSHTIEPNGGREAPILQELYRI
ncbi:MAG: class I SAM-dependent methyltransferase, partial [Planctomycetota bacterium]